MVCVLHRCADVLRASTHRPGHSWRLLELHGALVSRLLLRPELPTSPPPLSTAYTTRALFSLSVIPTQF